jgi:hypothetical protein
VARFGNAHRFGHGIESVGRLVADVIEALQSGSGSMRRIGTQAE